MWLAALITRFCGRMGAGDPLRPVGGDSHVAPPPAPIYCRQNRFSLPFHIDRPTNVNREPVEVKLYVSGDRGVNWQPYFSVKPTAGNIPFRAGSDGEYFFDVHTIDRSGQERPTGPHSAKLIVVVDTTPPKIQIDARRGEAGQVTASFHIDEAHPKLDTLTLDYRIGPTSPWQTMPIARNDIHANNAEPNCNAFHADALQ